MPYLRVVFLLDHLFIIYPLLPLHIRRSGGKVIKNTGECILFYFPKTYEINDTNAFQHGIECCFKILDDRLLSIVPGVSKKQIMRKPVDKKLFINTVNNLLN